MGSVWIACLLALCMDAGSQDNGQVLTWVIKDMINRGCKP